MVGGVAKGKRQAPMWGGEDVAPPSPPPGIWGGFANNKGKHNFGEDAWKLMVLVHRIGRGLEKLCTRTQRDTQNHMLKHVVKCMIFMSPEFDKPLPLLNGGG